MNIWGVLILSVLVSCEFDWSGDEHEVSDPPINCCPDLGFLAPEKFSSLYSMAFQGKSCEYLEERLVKKDSPYSDCVAISSSGDIVDASDVEVLQDQNTVVDNVLEQRSFVYNKDYSFQIKGSHLFIYSIEEARFLKSEYVGLKDAQMILSDDHLIISGDDREQSRINIYKIDNQLKLKKEKSWDFSGKLNVQLSNDNLIVTETVIDPDVKNYNCNDVWYLGDGTSSKLTIIKTIDLKRKKITDEQIYFGGVSTHIDEKNNFIYTSSYYETALMGLYSDYGVVIDGIIPNKFSIKEKDNALMLFLERGNANSFVVLDEKFNYIFEYNGIAPGEDIYATRFDENKAYLVTFQTVDPLFSFDISDVRNPNLIDELKVPGFSRYMHIVGTDLLLTLGMEDSGWFSEVEINLYDTSKGIRKLDSLELDNVRSLEAFYNHQKFHQYGNYIFLTNYDEIFVIKLNDNKIDYLGSVMSNYYSDVHVMGVGEELWVFDEEHLVRYDLENELMEIID